MSITTDPANGPTTDDRQSGQAQVPKPPSHADVEEISRSQEYLTDDWTGDGGDKPPGDKQGGGKDG
ncbi:hypothetical protein ABNQ38_33300 [Azospirillum sp. A29]|uniref:hypothetical protein n=1 Tax=Azospirillum sp. A29 TaxID=3160606 RepID=UPI00366A7204